MFGLDKKYIAQNIIVGLDFDGLLAQGVDAKIKYAKEWYGVNITPEHCKKDTFAELMQKIHRQDVKYSELMDRVTFEHTHKYKIPGGCIPTLQKLYSEGFRFVIITSRDMKEYPAAIKFIKQHFGGLIKYIHNTRNQPKDQFVNKIRPRIYMDDDLSKLNQIAHCAVELFWYRQPENYNKTLNISEFLTG